MELEKKNKMEFDVKNKMVLMLKRILWWRYWIPGDDDEEDGEGESGNTNVQPGDVMKLQLEVLEGEIMLCVGEIFLIIPFNDNDVVFIKVH